MKQQTNIEKKAKSQNRQGIKDALSLAFRKIIRIQTEVKYSPPLEGFGGDCNIFLMQNKGKGPPGRVRSPETGCCLEPDNQPVALKNIKINYIANFQYFNNYQISNFNNN